MKKTVYFKDGFIGNDQSRWWAGDDGIVVTNDEFQTVEVRSAIERECRYDWIKRGYNILFDLKDIYLESEDKKEIYSGKMLLIGGTPAQIISACSDSDEELTMEEWPVLAAELVQLGLPDGSSPIIPIIDGEIRRIAEILLEEFCTTEKEIYISLIKHLESEQPLAQLGKAIAAVYSLPENDLIVDII